MSLTLLNLSQSKPSDNKQKIPLFQYRSSDTCEEKNFDECVGTHAVVFVYLVKCSFR